MPDGDRIHTKLDSRYQKVYKQLCELRFSEEEIAHNFLNPFKQEIQQQGAGIISLINKFSALCEKIAFTQAFGHEINWDKEEQLIEKLSQDIYAKNFAKELAMDACKEQLQDIRHGIGNVNFSVEIMKKYFWNLYVAKFASRVPLQKQHDNGTDSEVVNARLAEMKQHIVESLSAFAEQSIRHNSFNSLRRPSQRKRNYNDDLDIDLTA